MTVIGAAGRGRRARLQLDWSDAVFDPNEVIRLSAEAIAFGYERCGLWKGAADVRVENVSRCGEAGSREQPAPHEPSKAAAMKAMRKNIVSRPLQRACTQNQ